MEIERKFLLSSLPELEQAYCYRIEQAYVETDPVIRVRLRADISADGALGKERYILTVKTGGLMAHEEFETDISKEAYERLCAKACGNVITKDRYILPLEDDLKLELDIFHGAFEGLVLGEVEFPSEEKARDYTPPSYIKEDVTMDGRFHNNRMSMMSSEEIEALLSSVHQL